MSYLEGHKNSGIKIGDRVKVLRKANDEENDWSNAWVDNMDKYIGQIVMVLDDGNLLGFQIGNYHFPYFVLEVVDGKKVAVVTTKSSCPQCGGEMRDKYSEYVGGNIQKCKSCGWC
jgi:hypothetical protein